MRWTELLPYEPICSWTPAPQSRATEPTPEDIGIAVAVALSQPKLVDTETYRMALTYRVEAMIAAAPGPAAARERTISTFDRYGMTRWISWTPDAVARPIRTLIFANPDMETLLRQAGVLTALPAMTQPLPDLGPAAETTLDDWLEAIMSLHEQTMAA